MGGYATKEAGTTPILRNDIPEAIEMFSRYTGIPAYDLIPLGSTGKAPWSSDIDLAIDADVYNPEFVKQDMSLAGPLVVKFHEMPGLGIQSYALQFKDQVVQFDLMFTKHLDWAEFAYWSPDALESDYKGAVRTMLLMGIAAQINVDGEDYFMYQDDMLMVRVGRTFDLNQGLRRICQYRPLRKDGKGFLKSLKTTTLDVLGHEFPDRIDVKIDLPTITDPEEALRLMFDYPIFPHQVEDAESVIRLIRHYFKSESAEKIFEKTAERAKSVQNKMKLPPEITRYL